MVHIENIDELKPGEIFFVNHGSGLLPKKKLFYMIYLKKKRTR